MDRNEPLQWNSSLSVGDVQIDRQHQHLFNLLHAMEGKFADSKSPNVARVLIGELRRYVEKHLRDEEWVLRSVGYADYEAHCAQHRVFEETLERLAGRLEDAAAETTLREIRDFVLQWLVGHVSTVDMQYKPFLKG